MPSRRSRRSLPLNLYPPIWSIKSKIIFQKNLSDSLLSCPLKTVFLPWNNAVRVCGVLSVKGYEDRVNKIYVSCTANAECNLIFFPGDAQDLRKNMRKGCHANYSQYCYEETAESLAASYPLANIFIIHPKTVLDSTYSCFDNFVESAEFGAVPHYSPNRHAADHLVLLLDNLQKRISLDYDLLKIKDLKICLVGFSKGVVVLNQLVIELALVQKKDNIKDNQIVEEPICNRVNELFEQVLFIHWVDGGNGSLFHSFPTDKVALEKLATYKIRLVIHSSPYQLKSMTRPWLKKELEDFCQSMKEFGCSPLLYRYFEDQKPTLQNHFKVINSLKLL